ncbi:MAG: cytochrome c peroxidase [Planctomycetota bacterium]
MRAAFALLFVGVIGVGVWFGVSRARYTPDPVDLSTIMLDWTTEEVAMMRAHTPLGEAPIDETNRWSGDEAAAAFGHALFFSPELSGNGEVSCVSCHTPSMGFGDGRAQARGIGEQSRHSQSLWNVAHQRWFTWDGRENTLWGHSVNPIEDPREMGSSRAHVAALMRDDPPWRARYVAVFGEPTSDDTEVFVNLGKAMAAYQERLVSRRSPFDVFVEGLIEADAEKISALSLEAQRGLRTFLTVGTCVSCHSGPNFSDGAFHSVRMAPLEGGVPTDAGRHAGLGSLARSEFTAAGPWSDAPEGVRARLERRQVRTEESWGAFRTPSLRNVALSAPYMHQGQKLALRDVVRHYSAFEGALAPGHHANDDPLLVPMELRETQIDEVVAFLESLTDEGSADARWFSDPTESGEAR